MARVHIAIWCLAIAASAMAAPPPPPNPMSGKSVAELAKILKSDAPEMDRANAALALVELVSPPKAEKGKRGKRGQKAPEWELKIPDGFIDACKIGLADRASAVRFYSGQALSQIGDEGLPALIEAVESDNDDVRISATHAIGMTAKKLAGKKGAAEVDLTPAFGSAVPVLRKALKDKNYIVREAACATFARLGTAGAPAIDDLIALLEDKQFCVVNQAVHAVAAADPGGAKSVPALVKTLKSEHDVREFIVKELGAMGKTAKPAVPALCKLVGEDKNSWHVALESTKALLTIVTYDEKPAQDAMVTERNQALNAIGEVLMSQDAKFLQARIRNTVLANTDYCPVGAEADRFVQYLEKALRKWAPVEPGYWGTPLNNICAWLVKTGQTYKRDEIVALAKELKAAKDTHESALKGLELIINLEKK